MGCLAGVIYRLPYLCGGLTCGLCPQKTFLFYIFKESIANNGLYQRLRHTFRIEKAAGHMLKTHVYNDYRDMCAAYQIEPTTASGKDLSESFFVLFCLALLLKDLTNGTG